MANNHTSFSWKYNRQRKISFVYGKIILSKTLMVMHLQPIYKVVSYINGVSEDLFNRGLCLPSGTNMKIDDLERVIKCINQLYEI